MLRLNGTLRVGREKWACISGHKPAFPDINGKIGQSRRDTFSLLAHIYKHFLAESKSCYSKNPHITTSGS